MCNLCSKSSQAGRCLGGDSEAATGVSLCAWLFLRNTNTVGAYALRMKAAYLSGKCVHTQQACVLIRGCGGGAGMCDPSNRMLLES